MLTKKEVIEILRRELPYFVSRYGVKRIGLFGSYAKGTQAEDSDVDVVVEFERPIGLKFIEFGDYLERILGKKTDILTPAGIEGIRIRRVAEDIRDSVVYV
ncbi:MAG: nucleotidyltransferase [Woeseiaceae bacterium]|jgi:predicted nucleotidyltransferase|nr:nucleotidyltransferase [Woeseiaceae bacterium]